MKDKQSKDETRIEEKRAHAERMIKHNEDLAHKKEEAGTSIN
jgi:hypothetical protein